MSSHEVLRTSTTQPVVPPPPTNSAVASSDPILSSPSIAHSTGSVHISATSNHPSFSESIVYEDPSPDALFLDNEPRELLPELSKFLQDTAKLGGDYISEILERNGIIEYPQLHELIAKQWQSWENLDSIHDILGPNALGRYKKSTFRLLHLGGFIAQYQPNLYEPG